MDPIRARSRSTRSRWLGYAIPTSLSLFGMWLLVGCIYLPIPEHNATANQVDFRPLVGTDEKPGPIHVGMARAQMVALLGSTPYVSRDGRTAVYFIDRDAGFLIGIECFGPIRYSAGLILTFDEHDVLTDFRIEYARQRVVDAMTSAAGIHTQFIETFVPKRTQDAQH